MLYLGFRVSGSAAPPRCWVSCWLSCSSYSPGCLLPSRLRLVLPAASYPPYSLARSSDSTASTETPKAKSRLQLSHQRVATQGQVATSSWWPTTSEAWPRSIWLARRADHAVIAAASWPRAPRRAASLRLATMADSMALSLAAMRQ